MNLALTLFFNSLPPLVGRGYLGYQARHFVLRCILSLTHDREFVSQNGDPLGRSGRLIMGGGQQRSFLLGHRLRLGSTGPCHYSIRLHSSHLLPKRRHLGSVPS
jgi:hypothetical protein